jgi:hypothetical protein
VAHTKGPANSTPTATSHSLPESGTPEATTPQENAHIGGNQVMGLNSSVTADNWGRDMAAHIADDMTMRQSGLTQFGASVKLRRC